MRDLYRKFLYIPKDEKITDQVFVTRITLSVLTMLFSLVALCSGTYAYFTDAVSTSGSTITSATYDLTIKSEKGIVTGEYTCIGAADHIYTFTLKAEGTATTGYCKVTIEGENDSPYFTHQIAKGTWLILKIKAAEGTKIKFEPSWGTSSAFVNGKTYGGEEKVIVCINAAELIAESVDETEKTTSTVSDTDLSANTTSSSENSKDKSTTASQSEPSVTDSTTNTTASSENSEDKSTTASQSEPSVTDSTINTTASSENSEDKSTTASELKPSVTDSTTNTTASSENSEDKSTTASEPKPSVTDSTTNTTATELN